MTSDSHGEAGGRLCGRDEIEDMAGSVRVRSFGASAPARGRRARGDGRRMQARRARRRSCGVQLG
ncbi:hypothetical protein BURPS406E_G0327 [Burkholderia pseudomallei 406e]|nr:hypothetical protein BURPS305_5243 [Burkholderia pseudomallei 305]EDK52128.1 hypothetical protein BMAFMH_I0192 [Burkholderia mallei FMH]EDK82737.1 hypothetical protein BMA721280_K0197 [Burkholderia mallei 2002721280]EDO87203.1 hypothetical protein BURPS406E_G0327 [Burkholderia pseudomallei 406e]EEP51958.1 hypothetical protein GBP346_B0507 [Burkholderia pseudomallei MSHR346]